jgi:hypothetical protein
MATFTPTKDAGATAEPAPMLSIEPQLQVTPDMLEGLMPGSGLNAPFVMGFLGAALTHERCGRHLYRSCEARSNNPILQAKYREFGAETERHVEILEQLIASAGGNPNHVSGQARAIELTDSKVLEATFMGSGSVDVMTAEMAMLDAVFLAECIDHANWQAITQLTQQLPAGELRDALEAAVAEVGAQEDEHLSWAARTRERLVMLQARSELMGNVGEKAEKLVARVRNWLSE